VIDLIKRHGEQLLTAMEDAASKRQWKTLIRLDGQLAELLRRLNEQPKLKEQLPMALWQARHRQIINQLEARKAWLGERLRGDSELREGKRAYREVQLYGGEKQ
jgi:hypothetical protein